MTMKKLLAALLATAVMFAAIPAVAGSALDPYRDEAAKVAAMTPEQAKDRVNIAATVMIFNDRCMKVRWSETGGDTFVTVAVYLARPDEVERRYARLDEFRERMGLTAFCDKIANSEIGWSLQARGKRPWDR